MKPVRTAPALAEQVYGAVLEEICEGRLAPGTHLVHEQLAERLGVSRQPVQQAMALPKADGMVEDVGRRGLRVVAIEPALMRRHYDIRAALDGLAARSAAARIRRDGPARDAFEASARAILATGGLAVEADAIRDQIRADEALHRLIHEASGNPLLAPAAEPQWRFLRRVMGDVLRHAEPPRTIWRQHETIVEAILAGDPPEAEARAVEHARVAVGMLAGSGGIGGKTTRRSA